MSPNKRRGHQNDWYRISVDSLRAWTLFFVVAGALAVGFLGFRSWEKGIDKVAAWNAMQAAETTATELESEKGISPFRSDLLTAKDAATDARRFYDQGDYRRALGSAKSSQHLLDWILKSLGRRDSLGEAQFLSVEGSVQYQRGESSDWEPAGVGTWLRTGDFVRTGVRGSAEIAFANGTRSTVRPNTMFRVDRSKPTLFGSSEQSIHVDYGWVNLDTSDRDSEISTPGASARIKRDSEASVSFDRGSGRGHFVNYDGAVEVASDSGVRREVQPLKQVVQSGSQLSSPSDLPGRPAASAPADDFQINLTRASQLKLDWSPVNGATRYALQVGKAGSRFEERIIDSHDRQKTGATLGLRAEGSFEWRVAAIDREGVQGPWSEPRRFRVAAVSPGTTGQARKLALDLHSVNTYGSIFMLSGTTEPGAELEINGERVSVRADGSFAKTIQVFSAGWSFLRLKARDSRGNTAEHAERVFVDAF